MGELVNTSSIFMNILHIISGGEKGGSKVHLLTLVRELEKKGVKTLIICFMEGDLYREAKALGIDVRLIKQRRRIDLSIIGKIKEVCVKEKINIINCHGGRANFVGFFLKRIYNARYISTIHSDYKDDYKGNLYKTVVFSNINRLVLNSFDYLITVSDNFKDMLIKRGFKSKKIFVVYNGMDFDIDKKIFTVEEVVEKYGLNKTSHYISMIARFHPVKGHKVFLDACKRVLNYNSDITFILVGDGELAGSLKEYVREIGIESNIKFPGFTSPEPFFSISDFTVLASYTESFPLSILESAFYEKTVIATEVGGIPKLIEDGVNGYLFCPGDSLTLSKKMIDLIDNPEKARTMGIKLHNKAKTNYSIEKFISSYMEIYNANKIGGQTND